MAWGTRGYEKQILLFLHQNNELRKTRLPLVWIFHVVCVYTNASDVDFKQQACLCQLRCFIIVFLNRKFNILLIDFKEIKELIGNNFMNFIF